MGKCNNSITVDAPIGDVWAAIRNFHDLSWAKGMDLQVDKIGDNLGDQVGAKRVLNGAFHETLHALSDVDHTITYSIDDGPGPVAKDAVRNYFGVIRLFEVTDTNTTFVQWTSGYDSDNDSAVGELCNPIYRSALKALQSNFA